MTEMLQSIKADLLSRRLLPLVGLLGVALLVAAGYALSGGSSGGSAPPATPPSASSPALPPGLAVVVAGPNAHAIVAETPAGKHYQSAGATRNPFAPLPSAGSPASSTPGKPSSGSSSTGSPSNAGGTDSTGAPSAGSSPGTGAPATPTLPKPAPQPIHVGLTSTQSYGVALALTTTAGGLNTIDPLERLSVLPSEQQPLLVYLGVLKGGREALFVVQPGTVVSGPGTCAPGPTDCEILSLGQEQVESLAVRAGSGTASVALFAVTAIKVDEYSSVAVANRARRETSAAGSALLAASTLPALPLFEYQPDVGAVVDLRNLEAGGK
jgi:hypothetical protein